MTVWDNIYKKHQKGGEAWATLSENIHPLFKQFLSQSSFNRKHVLDIGCGTGRYLKILQAGGFKTDGIDSSQIAVEMTKKLLNDDSNIVCVSMFDFEIPDNEYDLIISTSTIHHGTKSQVQDLVNKIYKVLIENGKFFITVPAVGSSKKWNTFKNHKKVSEGTFIPLSGPEKGLPHSFFTKEEIEELFSRFKNVELDLDEIGRWVIDGIK